MRYEYVTKRKKKLLNRYMKNIVHPVCWTKKELAAFEELNEKILELQEFVRNKMLVVNKEFLNLQKEFPFLKGFQVIGQIGFCKAILNDEADEETCKTWPEKQRKEYELWNVITDCTDSTVWQLNYDSIEQDFTPYSKDLLKDKVINSWKSGLPDNVFTSSYLNSLVQLNQSITFKDLKNCTIEDFYPFVFVTVNFDDPEVVGFRNYRNCIPVQTETLLIERRRVHNQFFEWTDENIEKILSVNEIVRQKSAFMKDAMTQLHAKFKELGKENELFRYFDIDAEIQYQNKNRPTDVADKKMLRMLQESTNFNVYSIRCNEETEKVSDHWHDDNCKENINWNFEVYRNHLSEEQKKIPFNYFGKFNISAVLKHLKFIYAAALISPAATFSL